LALEIGQDPPLEFSAISTDTRTLSQGALFVALSGERFDGHEYLHEARDRGATGAVVRQGTPEVPGLHLFPVPDTLVALGDLARGHRDTILGPVVAITGSNGKTSTKEMVAAVLGTRFATHATRANLNNLIGIPLTILAAPRGTEALVLEAGASVPGEISRAREIIDPTIAIITNVGAAHLEGFGSLEGVMEEKLALAKKAPLAIVGAEPSSLAEGAQLIADRVITAGLENEDVMPDGPLAFDDAGRARVRIDHLSFTLPAPGRHLAANAMLAWALVRELALDPLAAAAAIEEVTFPGGRGEVRAEGGLTILNDCYNANPASFSAAIGSIAGIRPQGRVIWVVGTMRELGAASAGYHADVARDLVGSDPAVVAAVGEFVPAFEAYRSVLGDRLVTGTTVEDLGTTLGPMLQVGDTVVLKASRGVALEAILPYLLDRELSPDG